MKKRNDSINRLIYTLVLLGVFILIGVGTFVVNAYGGVSPAVVGHSSGELEEADPTVLASVKDGVAWTEISNRPAGLDDGDDIGIKAWAYVAVSGGVPTLVDGYNIADIVDTGVGQLTINWDTDFANTDYAVVGTAFGQNCNIIVVDTKTTGSCLVESRMCGGANPRDPEGYHIIAIENQ